MKRRTMGDCIAKRAGAGPALPILAVAWCGLVLAAVAPGGEVSVPEGPQVAEAEHRVQAIFENQYAKRTPTDRQALAQILLRRGRETHDDNTVRYVLYREARDLAVVCGDVKVALGAIDAMAETFHISAINHKADTLAELARSARTAEQHAAIAHLGLSVVGEAVRSDDFDLALQTVNTLKSSALRSRNRALKNAVLTQQKEIGLIRSERHRVEPALAKLRAAPDDPESNLIVGRLSSLFKGDWAGGLPLLAKGSDPALAAVAKLDLADPADPSEQVKVADAWWALSQGQAGVSARRAVERAEFWYRKAQPSLSGLSRGHVDLRLAPPGSITWGDLVLKPGLIGEYFTGSDFTNRVLSRIDPRLDFDWKDGSPAAPVPTDHFCARWTGWLKAPQTGRYPIKGFAYHRARIWINGQMICAFHGRATVEVELLKGYNALLVEYWETKNLAKMHLSWSIASGGEPQPIPAEVLFHEPSRNR